LKKKIDGIEQLVTKFAHYYTEMVPSGKKRNTGTVKSKKKQRLKHLLKRKKMKKKC